MKRIKNNSEKVLKMLDIFGKPITLNFDKKGDTHKSFFGSIMSLILISIILAFAGSKISVMIQRQQVTRSSITIPKDPNSVG